MMRFLILCCLLVVAIGACGSQAAAPTPLPTAVPPDRLPEEGGWAVGFQYEFPPDTFGSGQHRFAFLIHCPVISDEDMNYGWHYFEISDEVVQQPAPVYLRLFGLGADPYTPTQITNDVIHPERPIIAVVHLVGLPQSAAPLVASSCEVLVFWDDIGRHSLVPGEPFQP
jgi:hypothetical protein